MTIKELVDRLSKYDEDQVVILGVDEGWANIDFIQQHGSSVKLVEEKYPVFSDN